MYKVIIVEDEDIIRQGILLSVDWNKYGFEVIGEARNGRDGLNKILDLKPDLVITDIKMPVMSGLDMIEEAISQHNFKTIILSSYGEFDYTKRAISLQVYDFILKPLDEEEIEALLLKLKDVFDSESVPKEFFDLNYYKDMVNNKSSYVYRLIELIEESYSEKLSIEQIADDFGVSNSYLSRKFKQATKHTFLDFLNKHRVQQALGLIEKNELKIYEVAEVTGFTDYKHFSSVFKKYLEVSPKKYVKRNEGYMFENYIILSDLDGTLLNKKSEVSEENLEAIEYFMKNGGKFGVATGRGYDNAMKYIKDLPTNNHCVFLNGAVLYDNEDKKYIKTFTLDKGVITEFIEMVRKSKRTIGIEISTVEKTYFLEELDPVFEIELEKQKPVEVGSFEKVKKFEWFKVLFVIDKVEDFNWIREKSEYLETDGYVKRMQSGKEYFELLPREASKGNMLEEIRELNDGCKIVAVGDYENDLEMVKKADVGIFTSEASEELKAVADYITVDCDNHVLKDIIYNNDLFK